MEGPSPLLAHTMRLVKVCAGHWPRRGWWLAIAGLIFMGELGIASPVTLRPAFSQTAAEETFLPEPERLYQEGLRLRDAGQLQAALQMLQRAFQVFSGNQDMPSEGDLQRQADILNQIGNIYLELEEYDLATEFYAQAIEVRQADQNRAGGEWAGQTTQPSEVRPINLRLPDIAASVASRSSGGSRAAALSRYGLMAVLPETSFGFTVSAYPKVFVSVPQPLDGITIEFRVYASKDDAGFERIYETTRSLTLSTAGIIDIDFADLEGMPALEMDNRYLWQIRLLLDSDDPSILLTAGGDIERANQIELLDTDTDTSSIETAAAYAEAGIWYDMFATLYVLRQQDDVSDELWQQVLQLADLDVLIAEPLLGDWLELSTTLEENERPTQSSEEPDPQTSAAESNRRGYAPPPDTGPSPGSGSSTGGVR